MFILIPVQLHVADNWPPAILLRPVPADYFLGDTIWL